MVGDDSSTYLEGMSMAALGNQDLTIKKLAAIKTLTRMRLQRYMMCFGCLTSICGKAQRITEVLMMIPNVNNSNKLLKCKVIDCKVFD